MLLRFNPVTNENFVLHTAEGLMSLSSIKVSETNENLMTFGNVRGQMNIFDIQRKQIISTHEYSFKTIFSLDFFQNLILVGDCGGQYAVTDIRQEKPVFLHQDFGDRGVD